MFHASAFGALLLASSATAFQLTRSLLARPALASVSRTSTPRGACRVAPLAAGFEGLADVSLSLATTAADYEFTGSYASLYATLGLFVLSFPGILSLVTRSVKVSVAQKTYVVPGPASPGAKETKQVAAEIMAYFTQNNFKVESATDTIVFTGNVQASKSQAFFLSFCLFGGLGCLALVLSIQLPVIMGLEIGNWWFLMTLVSPYAGIYYIQNAQSKEEMKVRLVTSTDALATEIIVQGSKEEVEQFGTVMDYDVKGMVRVRGILENKK